MDGRDESAGRNGADQQAFGTQDTPQFGRDGRSDPLPAEYGEPPETLQVIPGRFLRDPNQAANPSGASPANVPSGGPAPSPAYPASAGFPGSSQPLPASNAAASNAAQQGSAGQGLSGGASNGTSANLTGQPGETGYSQSIGQRGPRSVPVLSRYPAPGSPTPSRLPGALGAAAAGAIAGGAVAGGLPAASQRSQGQPAPANGTMSAGVSGAVSRSQRPYVVEEVQEVPVRDVPVTNPPVSSRASAAVAPSQENGWGQRYAQAGLSAATPAAPREGALPSARSAVPSEPYSYQPFASTGAQPAVEPWHEPARGASRSARGAVLGPEEAAPAGDQGLTPGNHPAPNGYVTITLNANNAAGFSYIFGWLSGIFFYFTERTNRFVRFHAMQSIWLTGFFTVIAALLYLFLLWLTTSPHDTLTVAAGVIGAALVFAAMFFVWLYTLIAAWSGHFLRLPIVGRWAYYFSAPVDTSYDASST